MSQVGEFFYAVAERECLMSNNKTFEGHTNCECYKSKKIENPVSWFEIEISSFSSFFFSISSVCLHYFSFALLTISNY